MNHRDIEKILDTGGRNLSSADRQFVTTLFSELEQFQFQAPKDRALMFHPLGGYQRYLIHKVTEIFPKLTSFSIGDDQNRRTVVCFKSKRKEQQMRQMVPGSPVKQHPPGRPNEYGPSPTRSRESSRARNKQHDTVPSRPTSRHGKNPDQTNYLPKPLRSKKRNSKMANSLPRSRSLHASPARRVDHDPYYSNDDSHLRSARERGDGPEHRPKDFQRSSSTRDKARTRSRPTSPESLHNRPKSATMTRSPTENSLRRRGQGLRLEGMVVNGDVEDPDNPDSEAEFARSDAEAIKREKSRKAKDKRNRSRRAKSEPELSDKESSRSRRRRKQVAPPHVGHPSDSDGAERYKSSGRPFSVNGHQKPDDQTPKAREPVGRRKSEASLRNKRDHSTEEESLGDESDERNHKPWSREREKARLNNRGVDVSSDTDDSVSRIQSRSMVGNDDVPPSYDKSSNMEPSVSKAKRNLNRIKRSDSLRSHPTSNRSPSNSSVRSDTTPQQPKETAPKHKTTATFPRHQRPAGSGGEDKVDGNAEARKRQRSSSTSTDHPPKYDNLGGQKPRRKSLEKGKSSKSKKARENAEPVKHSPHKKTRPDTLLQQPSEENIGASEATLYTPLPDKLVSAHDEPALEHEYVNKPQNMVLQQQQPPSSHSTLSSPITDGSQGFNTTMDHTDRCDGEAQTELSGTLTRKAASKRNGAVARSSPAASDEFLPPKLVAPGAVPAQPRQPPAPSTVTGTNVVTGNEKLMEEFCKVMLNFQKMFIASQTSATPSTEPSFPGPIPGPGSEPFHPFRAYYAGSSPDSQVASPVPPAALYNQFPPHVAHQLYLSWMAAYYAGATGSWPPPPPPFQSRLIPNQSHGTRHKTPPMPEMPHVPYDHVEGDRGDPIGPSWDGWYPKHHDQELQPDYYQPYSVPSYKGQKDNLDSEPTDHKSKDYPSESDHPSQPSHPNWQRDGKSREYPSSRLSHSSSRASKPSESARHRSNSAGVTDGADTDVSSVTSSSTHPEVAMKESKTGVVVYVRSSSQSNSQANSTISGGEDGISLHSSSSHGLSIPTKVTAASVAGRPNNHSRDGDDEETPDPDTKPKASEPVPGELSDTRKNGPGPRRHGKKGLQEGREFVSEDKSDNKRLPKKNEIPTSSEMPANHSEDDGRDSESDEESHMASEPLKNPEKEMAKPDAGSEYYDWTPNKELYSSPPYDSIVEIHDFPPEFKDKDILKHFRKIKGFKLVWVDDTHALGMLPSAKEASMALGLNVPMMRLRPLVHASSQSRKKAKVRVEEFGDYGFTSEPPPERSSVVAKRMVLGALGLKESQKDKEKRAELEGRRQSKKKKA